MTNTNAHHRQQQTIPHPAVDAPGAASSAPSAAAQPPAPMLDMMSYIYSSEGYGGLRSFLSGIPTGQIESLLAASEARSSTSSLPVPGALPGALGASNSLHGAQLPGGQQLPPRALSLQDQTAALYARTPGIAADASAASLLGPAYGYPAMGHPGIVPAAPAAPLPAMSMDPRLAPMPAQPYLPQIMAGMDPTTGVPHVPAAAPPAAAGLDGLMAAATTTNTAPKSPHVLEPRLSVTQPPLDPAADLLFGGQAAASHAPGPVDRHQQRCRGEYAAALSSAPAPPPAATEPIPGLDEHNVRSLTIPSDRTYLDPVHCFVRGNCIEVFVATRDDMTAPGRGSRPSRAGQVGFRCIFCKDAPRHERSVRQAVCFPSKLDTIFESVRNYRRVHLEACPFVPEEVKAEYRNLNGNESHPLKKPQKMVKAYYAEAAAEIGLVDTTAGLIYGAKPNTTAVPSQRLGALIEASESPSKFALFYEARCRGNGRDEALEMKKFESVASPETRRVIAEARREASTFVYPHDFPTISDVDFLTYHQVTCCRPTASRVHDSHEAPSTKTSGLCCKHCARANAGDADAYIRGIYFPNDLATLSDSGFSQTLLNHIMGCPNVPREVKRALDELKRLAVEYGVATKRGSKKNFFKKLWARMERYYE